MPRLSRVLVAIACIAPPVFAQSARPVSAPSIAQFLSPASPLSLVAAKKADRVAWMAYERGMRNVYTAAAPSFKPTRLTNWTSDDGVDVTNVNVSDDGATVVFIRGHMPNRQGWIANPNHDPDGGERAIWAVRATGQGRWSAPWRVADGGPPILSPDGRRVLYLKDGQIYMARVAQPAPADSMQRGAKPFIKAWGRQSNPRWSPDGSKIAFVSDRVNHSFIAVYDVRARTVNYVSPSVDCDGAPTWSPDGKRIAFLRRPGVPFGRQGQQGSGSIGNPPGPAVARGGGAVGSCGFGGFGGGGGGGGGQQQQPDTARVARTPGFFDNALPGGHRLSIMVADVSTCTHLSDGCSAAELWRAAAGDRVFSNINQITWAADNIIFPLSPMGDEWDRYYSISISNPQPQPLMLTTTDGLIEGAVSAALSRDGMTLFYCTNAQDIERRHIWAVPTSGGTPVQISTGAIETNPQPLASGKQIAVLYFDAAQPASVGLVPASGGKAKVIFPTLGKDFPVAAHVTPQIEWLTAPDSVKFSSQLFLPADLKPGERRPALIFVHGGPSRQMLPGYHYMQFYHWFYAYNQWLANQGYVVMSVNYRRGIGYGRSFQQAPNTQARGNAEYQDVLAAGRYLQTRPDVDPTRIGIWGLSYGGLLTAQALARNSDLFVAGADLAGVHLYGNSLDPEALSFKSSAVGAIDGWKSPVFLVHGDDDRNVDFAQTVGLVSLLRARNVYYELMVVPDDLHESWLHENWIVTFNRMGDFFKRFVWNREAPGAVQAGQKQPK
ncbi:MAG: prolyl oligopeptidase family serine peptidase [Gemmatimonadaceae bacterium]